MTRSPSRATSAFWPSMRLSRRDQRARCREGARSQGKGRLRNGPWPCDDWGRAPAVVWFIVGGHGERDEMRSLHQGKAVVQAYAEPAGGAGRSIGRSRRNNRWSTLPRKPIGSPIHGMSAASTITWRCWMRKGPCLRPNRCWCCCGIRASPAGPTL